MRTGWDVFRLYCSLKAHFNNPKYDYVERKGRVTCRRRTYENRKDRMFFERLANKNMDYIVPFLVANFVANENLWIGDLLLNQEAEETYFSWRKGQSRIYTKSIEEMGKIQTFLEKRDLTFDQLFEIKKGQQPIIFRLLVQRFISLETYIIMDEVVNFSERFRKILVADYVFEKWDLKVKKYKTFLDLDVARCKENMKIIFVKRNKII